ncbi:uncharacterized protein N7459_002931 [Penicillium hispanicum]|uniref:uncharacterized protein n=1 Tax=Penicillium hispanicum TaxID=1080232 RepID=UPI00253F6EE6|nr:uncharacterized protein N7459_002931 [Penicillium hispanicum]KAJ5587166.1 hypothetical protein N7459_002931 [Penicillium hispanicum]
MGFFSWPRRKSPPNVAKDEVTPKLQDPFRPTQYPRTTEDEDEDLNEELLSMPGAFPPSPSLSPQLAPIEVSDEIRAPALDRMDIEVASLDLPTDLGSHLRPRRPASLTSTPRLTHVPPSVVSKPSPQPQIEDAMEIDDPWNKQSMAFARLPFGRPVSAVSLFYPQKRPLPANRIASIFASEWERREQERAALEREQRRPARIVPSGPCVRELPWDWLNRVSQAMKSSDGSSVARSLSGDDLYQKDIATCVRPLAWLNDEIINAYLTVLVQYLRQSTGNATGRPRFHAFNSFFYSTLRDKGYPGVRRWANRAKIGGEGLLDVDTVFVPVHESSHWTLMVVRPIDRTIEYFDSLGGRGARQVKTIKEWLRGELAAKFDEEEWTVLPSVSSYQDNGSDCGVFLLTNAKAIALGIEPTAFGANDTPLLRRKIVAELMNQGLHGEFSPVDKTGHIFL